MRLLLVASVLVFAPPLAAAEPSPYPQDIDYGRLSEAQILALDCEGEVSAGIDRFASECYARQWEVSRRQVGEAYAKALANAAPKARPRLEKSQRDWQRYAESACALWEGEEGTWPAMLADRCQAKIARARAAELQGLEAID